MPETPSILEGASEKLKDLVNQEKSKPQYQKVGQDLLESVILTALFQAGGNEIFNPENAVDSILMGTFNGMF